MDIIIRPLFSNYLFDTHQLLYIYSTFIPDIVNYFFSFQLYKWKWISIAIVHEENIAVKITLKSYFFLQCFLRARKAGL